MSKFILFGVHVLFISWIARDFKRHPFHNLQAVSLNSNYFSRIICHLPHTSNAQHEEHLCSHSVITQIIFKTQFLICFHCVLTFFLEVLRLKFGDQSNPASFLRQIKDYAFSFTFHLLHCCMELRTTIAAE